MPLGYGDRRERPTSLSSVCLSGLQFLHLAQQLTTCSFCASNLSLYPQLLLQEEKEKTLSDRWVRARPPHPSLLCVPNFPLSPRHAAISAPACQAPQNGSLCATCPGPPKLATTPPPTTRGGPHAAGDARKEVGASLGPPAGFQPAPHFQEATQGPSCQDNAAAHPGRPLPLSAKLEECVGLVGGDPLRLGPVETRPPRSCTAGLESPKGLERAASPPGSNRDNGCLEPRPSKGHLQTGHPTSLQLHSWGKRQRWWRERKEVWGDPGVQGGRASPLQPARSCARGLSLLAA